MSGKRDNDTEVAKAWDRTELKDQGALDPDRKTRAPDLSGTLHPIFAEDRWAAKDQKDGTVAHLHQSLLLASRLLEAGIEYVAHFLPADQIYKLPINPKGENLNKGMGNDRSGSQVPRLVPLRSNITANEIKKARRELDELAEYIEWQTDPLIYRRNGWHGITIQVKINEPYKAIELRPELIANNDQKLAGNDKDLSRRPLLIAIMSEYSDTIKSVAKDSEQYLRATFMAGVTIAHELGHALFWQDFRAWTPDSSEMFVGEGCRRELGHSFMSFIFDDKVPETVHWGSFKEAKSFNTPLYWLPQYRKGQTRYLHKELKSLSTDYLERIMTQSSWDGAQGLEAMLNLLRSNNRHATSLEPDFQNGGHENGITWRAVPGGGHRVRKYEGTRAHPPPDQTQIRAAEKWRIEMKSTLPTYLENYDDDDDIEERWDPVYQDRDVKNGLVEVLKTDRRYWGKEEWTKVEVKYRPYNAAKRAREDSRSNINQAAASAPVPSVSIDLIDSICTINNFTRWNYYDHGWFHADSTKLGTWDTEKEAEARGYRNWTGPDQDDLAMMAKIRNSRIKNVESRYPGDTLAGLILRKLSLLFVQDWHKSDLVRYCKDKNIDTAEQDGETQMRDLVRGSIHKEHNEFQAQLGDTTLPDEVDILIRSAAWSNDLIEQHLRSRNIRGSNVPLQNNQLVMKDLANKAKGTMPKVLYRINNDGDQVYGFMVKLMATIGLDIEGALLHKIQDRPQTVTESQLFFDEIGPKDPVLRDDPLGRNGPYRDWSDLRFTIRGVGNPINRDKVAPPDLKVQEIAEKLVKSSENVKRLRTAPKPTPAVRPPTVERPPEVAPAQRSIIAEAERNIQDLQGAVRRLGAVVIDMADEDRDVVDLTEDDDDFIDLTAEDSP